MIDVANIMIRENKAYLPTIAKLEGSGHMITEPVYSTEVNVTEITEALKKLIDAGHSKIESFSEYKATHPNDPVLKATGAKSWLQMAKNTKAVAIIWNDDNIQVIPSKLDKRSRFVNDYDREKKFSKETSLEDIIDFVLNC